MMIWNGKWFIQLFILGLDITFVFKYVKYRQVSLPVLNCLFFYLFWQSAFVHYA